MTLTTHSVIGAAAFSLFPASPILGLGAALSSHYLCDAIPHWDLQLHSMRKDQYDYLKNDFVFGQKTIVDLAKISFDFGLGLLLAYFIFGNLWGALAGMLPDLLQFCYFKFRLWPLRQLQRLHHFFHSPIRLDNRPVLGLASQALLIIAVAVLTSYLM